MCRRNESSPLCEMHPEFGVFITLEMSPHRLTKNLTLLDRLIHPLSSNRNPVIGEKGCLSP